MRTLLLALVAVTAACAGSRPAPGPAVAVAPASTPLTRASLLAFAEQRFPTAIRSGVLRLEFGAGDVEGQVLEEAGIMGITTVEQLAGIVPGDYETKGIPANPGGQNLAGLVRDLLVLHDAERYFTTAWRDAYVTGGAEGWPGPAAYGVDLHPLEARGLLGDDDGDGDGDDGDDSSFEDDPAD